MYCCLLAQGLLLLLLLLLLSVQVLREAIAAESSGSESDSN
jgi:hypothetical protein